jgi:HD superfamily phosphohydrolase YqeK
MPVWAQVTPERRAHIERVVRLLGDWAHALEVSAAEQDRWLRAAWLHDALRDVPAAHALAHGPMAADRAARDGERDRGVLDAVRHHSLGYAGWDDVGRMLYLADYLEPGREFDRAERALLAARVPLERDAVLLEVARRRMTRALNSAWPLPQETVEFWNDLVGRSDRRTAGR